MIEVFALNIITTELRLYVTIYPPQLIFLKLLPLALNTRFFDQTPHVL